MKIVFALAFLVVSLAGCAGNSGHPSSPATLASPAGTDVGTSDPGVNQPTTTTTASRSNSAPR